MSGFINTADVVGDEALTNSIIDKSVTEYKDNAVKRIGTYVFYKCEKLRTVDCPRATSIGGSAFEDCAALEALILRSNTQCTTNNIFTLSGSKIANGGGYVYVPSALVDLYKAATCFNKYPNQIRALEEYTVDGTTTGELDPTKI